MAEPLDLHANVYSTA